MPNEKKIEETQKKVEDLKKDESKKDEVDGKKETEPKVDEKVDKKVDETIEKKTEEVDKKVDDKVDDKKEDEAEEEKEVEVQNETPSANAIRVEDVVTKEELDEKLQAFEAKFFALAEENKQLKEANAKLLDEKNKAETETEEMKNKYERSDFGNITTKGVSKDGKGSSYQSFDEYSKNFN